MRGWLFWIFATILLMVCVHLGTVLLSPRLEGSQRVQVAMNAGELNRLSVLESPQKVYDVLGEVNRDMVYAICPFDVTQRPITITARVPDRYWSMAVYGEDGTSLYTLNDKQVGVDSFFAELKLDTEGVASPDEAAQRDGESLTIRSPFERGIIIFRSFAADGAERDRVRTDLLQTQCSTNRPTAGLSQ